MKFFTPEWLTGSLTEEEAEAVIPAYRAHVETLAPGLPAKLRLLATEIQLHDALIRRVVVDTCSSRLLIGLVCGDLQLGYFDLELLYSGLDEGSSDLQSLREAAEDSGTELLYHEVDREGGDVYVHRLLFNVPRSVPASPCRQVSVRFRDLDMTQVSRLDREVPRGEAKYQESKLGDV